MQLKTVFEDDLKSILKNSELSFQQMKNTNIFISGATGFFGKWLIQSLLYASDHLNLNIKITILTRNKLKSINEQAWLRNLAVSILEGDVSDFTFPKEKFHYIIHAATEASARLNEDSPEKMADTIIDGTRRMLKMAVLSDCPNFLFVSSGAVYGKQAPDVIQVKEDSLISPSVTDVGNSYAESKRMAELYCQFYQKKKLINLSIARCFAFVGPYLPLGEHFAIGNFINNLLKSETISLSGDGSPIRTYMYPTDLIEWLLKILINEKSGEPYNVGSNEEIQILELAKLIDEQRDNYYLPTSAKGLCVTAALDPSANRNAYVPSIEKSKECFDLSIKVDLREAISRTISWQLS